MGIVRHIWEKDGQWDSEPLSHYTISWNNKWPARHISWPLWNSSCREPQIPADFLMRCTLSIRKCNVNSIFAWFAWPTILPDLTFCCMFLKGNFETFISLWAPSKVVLKGIVHQFWTYNIFSCLNRRIIFYKRSISMKQLKGEIIEKNCSQSQSLLYIHVLYITALGWTDFEHSIFSIISS